MRIAYVSFEYPPDTASGGIATYVHQVANMMHGRGHNVEIFCASPTRAVSENIGGIMINRILTDDRLKFRELIVAVFQERHQEEAFDLAESPEYMGDGYNIKKLNPRLPLVVKLHTPASFIDKINGYYFTKDLTPYAKFRFVLGGVIRGKIREHYWKAWDWKPKERDVDYLIATSAEQIHTPSISLGDVVSEKWNIPRERILNVPYPFIPSMGLLDIPIVETKTKNITFIGRLEIRKGLIALVEALPSILEKEPDAKVVFVGKSLSSIEPGVSMKEYITKKLDPYKNRIEFAYVTAQEIPALLSNTDVCVFPSIWENFPNVCLEAMSAGRAIVGSNKGGMYDMLNEPQAGILVNPLSSQEITDSVLKLLQNSSLRMHLGLVARNSVLSRYNKEQIGALMEKNYLNTIDSI